jgi:SAM-dependent methyltransferase
VERVRALEPTVDIRLGDVTAMPVADGSVHTYYSGGVVEHFESGPEPALREARRVMAPDGWLFCSVPDASTLRTRLVFHTKSTYAAARKVPGTITEPVADDLAFFQYAFSKDEFISRLEAAGFKVEETIGYSLLWGLMEIPGVARLVRASQKALGKRRPVSANGAHSNGTEATAANGHASRPSGGIKGTLRAAINRLVFQEDTGIPVAGSALALALEHCSNLRMYVARPR